MHAKPVVVHVERYFVLSERAGVGVLYDTVQDNEGQSKKKHEEVLYYHMLTRKLSLKQSTLKEHRSTTTEDQTEEDASLHFTPPFESGNAERRAFGLFADTAGQ